MSAAKEVDQFIAQYPADTQAILQKVRRTIQAAAPDAQEKIGYGIPTFTYKGNLIHFSAYEHHLGIYPGAQAIVDFADELQGYETSKGTIKFPLDQPIPYELIDKITRHRAAMQDAKGR